MDTDTLVTVSSHILRSLLSSKAVVPADGGLFVGLVVAVLLVPLLMWLVFHLLNGCLVVCRSVPLSADDWNWRRVLRRPLVLGAMAFMALFLGLFAPLALKMGQRVLAVCVYEPLRLGIPDTLRQHLGVDGTSYCMEVGSVHVPVDRPPQDAREQQAMGQRLCALMREEGVVNACATRLSFLVSDEPAPRCSREERAWFFASQPDNSLVVFCAWENGKMLVFTRARHIHHALD